MKQSTNLKTFYGVQESIPSKAESILGILKCLQIRAQETTELNTVNYLHFAKPCLSPVPKYGDDGRIYFLILFCLRSFQVVYVYSQLAPHIGTLELLAA